MISQTAEYALRAIVYLADCRGEPRTNLQIAAATQVPPGYLAKVMQLLARGRIVRAQRGPHGGFTLRRPAEQLSVLDVVNAVDPIRRFPECPLGLAHHGKNLCPLHRRLDEAARLAEDCFRETTVAEILATPTSSKALCRFPLAAPAAR